MINWRHVLVVLFWNVKVLDWSNIYELNYYYFVESTIKTLKLHFSLDHDSVTTHVIIQHWPRLLLD